jgi:hypothetical protein
MTEAYDLYQEGRERLKKGMTAQATVPLEKAKKLEPDKASIREALGIAYFRIQRQSRQRRIWQCPARHRRLHALCAGRALENRPRRRGERHYSSRAPRRTASTTPMDHGVDRSTGGDERTDSPE